MGWVFIGNPQPLGSFLVPQAFNLGPTLVPTDLEYYGHPKPAHRLLKPCAKQWGTAGF